MRIIPFKGFHIRELADYGGQYWLKRFVDDANADKLYPDASEDHPAHTATVNGDVIACAGLIKWHAHRATAWAFISNDMKKKEHFMPAFLFVRDFLRAAPFRRIEAFVDVQHEPSMRLCHLLGFKKDGPPKPFWFVDGRTAQEWAIIKDS
jgi:hypothetical protein